MSISILHRHLAAFASAVAATFVFCQVAEASYGLYVGKNRTADGSVFLGGTGEEVSSHWLRIEPRKKHGPGETISVGVTKEAVMPGEMMEIPQVGETAAFISMDYSDYEGFPPPLTNGGLNEYGVAVRDIWSPSRKELIAMTPNPQKGPQYSDLARIALERAKTAREAVQVIGDLINQYGYSDYGGNSHLIADANEGWVVINFSGGKGLWVAERLGPDDVRMSYPGYIGEIPLDYQTNQDFMGSANLISFAAEQGWYEPGHPFDVHKVYGDQTAPMRSPGVEYMESKLQNLGAKVTLREFMDAVRDPVISDDAAGYGQVAQLKEGVRNEMQLLWVAPTSSVTAPFIPWRIGVGEIPAEYRWHRYMTKGAASNYLTAEYAQQEATEYAFHLYKRLLYYTCSRRDEFYDEVVGTLTAFENHMIDDQAWVEQSAEGMFERGENDSAKKLITYYSGVQAMRALDLGNALLSSMEQRTKLLQGIPQPPSNETMKLEYNMIRCGPTPESLPSTPQ
ncbi:MAG: peptidase U34 [Mesorhizobium sp.]|uniref:C69 family dipeptidase n=1 Tax=Mesorhizobium sp. TaxID=1871066 RepID=UPI001200A181|nr:C69 family dipeptidase [Mesorhizobium sp.]TIP25882.1 MAG: peptidase U34 [Mesorhizobium sp.]